MDPDAIFCNECGMAQVSKAEPAPAPQPKSEPLPKPQPLTSHSVGSSFQHESNKLCPNCKVKLELTVVTCDRCGYRFSAAQVDSSRLATTLESSRVQLLQKRYLDAYRIARVVNSAGQTIKVLGFCTAGALGFLGLVLAGFIVSTIRPSQGGEPLLFAIIIIFGFLACLIAGVAWILGVIVSAQGQILRAQLDSAVNSSPFLNESEKAMIMSLPT